MNNIIYNDKIITPENNKYHYYYNFLNKIEQRDCVKFALFCAKIADDNSKGSNLCIILTEKWLKNGPSLNKQELDAAATYTAYTAYAAHADGAASIAAYTAYTAYYAAYVTTYSLAAYAAKAVAVNAAKAVAVIHNHIINDINLYLQTLLRTTKQYNTINHNNQHYESILKEIIKEDIDKVTDTDYNMLTDISQEYYNINPNITNKRIFIELLRREYE